jgi:hypothetical protein
MNTFNSFCISACMFMIFLGMASIVVGNLGISSSSPVINTTEAQKNFLKDNANTIIWVAGGTLATIASIASYFFTRSTVIMGVTIFAGIFWTSWIAINKTFLSNFFIDSTTHAIQPAAAGIIGMLWLGMAVMFIGAVQGMLTGSIWMK